MARARKEIDELASKIQNLPRTEQVSVLERVLTPHLVLELALRRWHDKTRRRDSQEMTRTVNRVAREVRRGRIASRRS